MILYLYLLRSQILAILTWVNFHSIFFYMLCSPEQVVVQIVQSTVAVEGVQIDMINRQLPPPEEILIDILGCRI